MHADEADDADPVFVRSTIKGGNRCAGMGAPSWPGPALPNTCEADNSLQFLTHPIPIDTPRCQHPTTPGVRPSTRASGAHDHRPSAANRKRDRNRGVDAPQTSAVEYNANILVLHLLHLTLRRPRRTAETAHRGRRRRRSPEVARPHAKGVADPEFLLIEGGSAPRGARAAGFASRIGGREDDLPPASQLAPTTTGGGEDARRAAPESRKPMSPRFIRQRRRRGHKFLQRRRRAAAPRRQVSSPSLTPPPPPARGGAPARQGRCGPRLPPTSGGKCASRNLFRHLRIVIRPKGGQPPAGRAACADGDGKSG